MKRLFCFAIAIIFSFITIFSAAAFDSTPLTDDDRNAIINDAFYKNVYETSGKQDVMSFEDYKANYKLSDDTLFLFYGRYGADNLPLVFISDLKIFGSCVYNIGNYRVETGWYASGPECDNHSRGFFLYRNGALMPLIDAHESGLMTDGDLGELCRSEFASQDSRISISFDGDDTSDVSDAVSQQAAADSDVPAVTDVSDFEADDTLADGTVLSNSSDAESDTDFDYDKNADTVGFDVSSDTALTGVKADATPGGGHDDKSYALIIAVIAVAVVLLAACVTIFALKKKHTNSVESRAENAGDTGADIKSGSDAEK